MTGSALLDRAAAALLPAYLNAACHSETEKSRAAAKRLIVLAVARVILTEPPSNAMLEAASDAIGESTYDVVVDALAALLADLSPSTSSAPPDTHRMTEPQR